MKRFHFQLEPVLGFKQQSLDALLAELAQAQARVLAQEKRREEARQALTEFDKEYAQKKLEGMTVLDARECQISQEVLEQRLRRETESLKALRQEMENKRDQVVEARKEKHVLERLREIKAQEYEKAVQKEEEKTLDDLTAARRASAV